MRTMLIKPFMGTVNASGQAVVTVSHGIHGLVWKVYQLGFALGKISLLAQTAAHINGIPLASNVVMQQSVFSQLAGLGQAPYAMESFMVGPPYPILSAGDQINVGVINAVAGDIFTVGAYIDERDALMAQDMGA
jgi:hypothetical protein